MRKRVENRRWSKRRKDIKKNRGRGRERKRERERERERER